VEGRKNRYEDGTPHFANPTRKTRWNDGEGNEAGRERALTVGYENRREGEIGTRKNKVG